MATPVRSSDPRDPRLDPMSPIPPADSDPLNPRTVDPRIDNRPTMQSKTSNGILIAAVIAVLAVIAYFMFAGGSPTPTDEASPPATTEPAPTEPAPAEPATPPAADTTAPAPDATAPAEPAPAPAEPAPTGTAPAEPAPAPAEPAPAQPAPAAPAQ
jgi:hypothetical protein